MWFRGTAPYASLEAIQSFTGSGGSYDLALADSYGAGATVYALLAGVEPVAVTEEEEAAAGDSLRDWEAALLRRVRCALSVLRNTAAHTPARTFRLRCRRCHRNIMAVAVRSKVGPQLGSEPARCLLSICRTRRVGRPSWKSWRGGASRLRAST